MYRTRKGEVIYFNALLQKWFKCEQIGDDEWTLTDEEVTISTEQSAEKK